VTTTDPPPHLHHPAMLAVERKRAQDRQLRVADGITAFAGSMMFVYIHAVIFGVWCGTGLFGLDRFPFNFLTMTVSLEAIFLSTFVMIGQNRQAQFSQHKADHDFVEQEQELKVNTELTRAIHTLATEIHAKVLAQANGVATDGDAAPAS
jgi:uncharacterized membrane protein